MRMIPEKVQVVYEMPSGCCLNRYWGMFTLFQDHKTSWHPVDRLVEVGGSATQSTLVDEDERGEAKMVEISQILGEETEITSPQGR